MRRDGLCVSSSLGAFRITIAGTAAVAVAIRWRVRACSICCAYGSRGRRLRLHATRCVRVRRVTSMRERCAVQSMVVARCCEYAGASGVRARGQAGRAPRAMDRTGAKRAIIPRATRHGASGPRGRPAARRRAAATGARRAPGGVPGLVCLVHKIANDMLLRRGDLSTEHQLTRHEHATGRPATSETALRRPVLCV